jgi:hypothetical protein
MLSLPRKDSQFWISTAKTKVRDHTLWPTFTETLQRLFGRAAAVQVRNRHLLRSGASYLEPAAERISREGSATKSGSLRSGAKVAAKVRSVLAAASTAAAASASWPV